MAKVYDYVLAGAAGYLLGSVNVGVLLSKHVYKDDVRTHGSGNAGATNMARTFGLKAGALTLGGVFFAPWPTAAALRIALE